MSWGPVGISHDCPLSLNTSTHTHVLWALCKGPLHVTIARPISHPMKMISRGGPNGSRAHLCLDALPMGPRATVEANMQQFERKSIMLN